MLLRIEHCRYLRVPRHKILSSSTLLPQVHRKRPIYDSWRKQTTRWNSVVARAIDTSNLSDVTTSYESDTESNTRESDLNNLTEIRIPTDNTKEVRRLQHIRNVGVFAHVDAGKTTVTERMLALAGVVHRCGSVDEGNTVTDYLPAERERGITIQSAAISFPWTWHNGDSNGNDHVTVSLIDTPGHVDFSVEVNRSVAVLDGAVLVVDSVAGVQAQTETVWRAMTRPSLNNHDNNRNQPIGTCVDFHAHEPLPCLAVINKMDKEGCHFGNAIKSLKMKLPGANPIPIQVPLFRITTNTNAKSGSSPFAQRSIVAVGVDDTMSDSGDFIGVIDLLFMRAIVYPEKLNASIVESCIPDVIPLWQPNSATPIDELCLVTQDAVAARNELVEALAECDELMEELYLTGRHPTHKELCAALRRVTLSQRGMPVMASAALRGMGVEPILDAIADFLPSPLDRQLPELTRYDDGRDNAPSCNTLAPLPCYDGRHIGVGHPLHPSLLALAFKVVHMKGRGGSGDGRIVFARIYSGELRDRDVVQVISPPPPGEVAAEPRKERVSGMLELSGGRFDNLQDGICQSGGVCALVGLKSVVTGDTIVMTSDCNSSSASKKRKRRDDWAYLSGVAAPKPVLQVRVEAESTEQQKRLSEALKLLSIEDPSLIVEETGDSTLLSGLGELHIDITLDRVQREFGLQVMVGPPSVTYRETIFDSVLSDGLVNYDRSVGGTRLQAAVSIALTPTWKNLDCRDSTCMILADPIVSSSPAVKEFLGLNHDLSEDDLIIKSELYRNLVQGCQGALKRGIVGPHSMANVSCNIIEIDAEDGVAGLHALPGALRAAAAHAVSSTLSVNKSNCSILEPTMSLEVTLPNSLVGPVLSDLTGCRRGCVGDVAVGDDAYGSQGKALIRGDVPLVEILGYANSLRSLTGGEGAFTAEYKGHSPVV
jgi:elongation factor G